MMRIGEQGNVEFRLIQAKVGLSDLESTFIMNADFNDETILGYQTLCEHFENIIFPEALADPQKRRHFEFLRMHTEEDMVFCLEPGCESFVKLTEGIHDDDDSAKHVVIYVHPWSYEATVKFGLSVSKMLPALIDAPAPTSTLISTSTLTTTFEDFYTKLLIQKEQLGGQQQLLVLPMVEQQPNLDGRLSCRRKRGAPLELPICGHCAMPVAYPEICNRRRCNLLSPLYHGECNSIANTCCFNCIG